MANKTIDLKTVWGQRIAGIGIKPGDLTRPVTAQDIEYLTNKYPFLQIVNTEATFAKEVETTFFEAQSGWIIHDSGEILSSSPGEFIYGGFNDQKFLQRILSGVNEGDESEGGAAVLPGKGTIIKQMVDTAFAMVDLAILKEWPGIQIVDGNELMKWAAWLQAKNKEVLFHGFDPSEKDEAKRERVLKTLTAIRAAEEAPTAEVSY